jgi:uncharacterized protein
VSGVLVDTGPLVAILSRSDEHHDACVATLREISQPLLSCWPVITEAAWLLRGYPSAVQRLLASIDGQFLRLLPMAGAEAAALGAHMRKYEDLNPQLADAALVYLAGREGIRRIFTLDQRDFYAYRGNRRRAFEIIPELG